MRLAASQDATEWAARIERGLVRITTVTRQHRAPSLPDLIIAATAELAGLTVLHLDKDFDVPSGVTGQPVERLSVP